MSLPRGERERQRDRETDRERKRERERDREKPRALKNETKQTVAHQSTYKDTKCAFNVATCQLTLFILQMLFDSRFLCLPLYSPRLG